MNSTNMYTLFLVVLLSFLLQTVQCNLSDNLQQQHFELQKNQMKIMDGMRSFAQTEHENRVNFTLKDLERRLKTMEQREERIKRKMEALIVEVKAQKSSAVFTRWGRTDCPSSTSHLLYSGSVGGSHLSHYGGATTYVCLPKNPQRLRNWPYSHAFLYGAEYDGGEFNNGIRGGDDVPCAVCQSKTGSQKMMIPARIECLPGWTKQYAGYLGTEKHSHQSSKEFICVDETAQAAHKGHHDDNGAMLYTVKTVCGSLPCPPYRNGDTVTCVVCTK